MSTYYSLDGGEPGQLASNVGWADVSHFVASLESAPQLAHLCAYGWSQNLPVLHEDVRRALSGPIPSTVKNTLRGLLEALAERGDGEVMTINNGIVASAGATDADSEDFAEETEDLGAPDERAALIDEILAHLDAQATGGAQKFADEKKDRNGRRYCVEKGRGRVKCSAESAQKETHEAHQHIQGLKAAPHTITPEVRDALGKRLAGMTLVQLHDLKRRLGLKASGLKSTVVTQLQHRALAKGKSNEPERPAEPAGSGRTGTAAPGAGRSVAEKTDPTGRRSADQGGHAGSKPAAAGLARQVPAKLPEVNKRIDRFEKFFRQKGQGHVADWLGKLREHVNAVGGEAALAALGEGAPGKPGKDGKVQYWGVGTEEANWKHMGAFMEAYLARNGIVAVTGETSDPNLPLVSALGKPDKYVAGDFKPTNDAFANKLDESKHLPGLEKSEDIGKLMGRPVTHLTEQVTAKLDAEYGPGKWIVKSYGDEAAAGYGIFFPQRAQKITEDARSTIWSAGEQLGKYGFQLARDPDTGKVFGLQHESGDTYQFGTPEYKETIHGDARHQAERAAAAADNEKGAMFPEGKFMAQPAFAAVGISDAERAAGKTWHESNEGRVHLVVRNGKAEVIPHSTWLKGGSLPVVFESDDTRAMQKAAQDAINQLPEASRKGQVYAPDVMRTPDGFRVVELNAQGDHNGSGYLHDNQFTIDAYTSHLVGREPMHVAFIRKLLATTRSKEDTDKEERDRLKQPRAGLAKHAEDASKHNHAGKGKGGGQFIARTKWVKPAKSPASAAPAATNHPATVASAFQKLARGDDPVSLAALHKASGLPLPAFQAAVQHLRKAGILTGSAIDRNPSAAEQAAAIGTGGDRIHTVSVRDPEALAKLLGGGKSVERYEVGGPTSHEATAEAWVAKSNLPDETKKKYTSTVTAVLGKMPDGCRKAALAAISEHGGGVVFHADVASVTSALEKETGKKERARVGGWVSHDPITGGVQVNIDGGAGPGAGDTAEGIYAHELGHAVDAGRKYSNDPKFQVAWKKEIFNGKTMLSAYARTSATEGFAELHRAIVQKGAEATRALFPKCVAYLAAKGLL